MVNVFNIVLLIILGLTFLATPTVSQKLIVYCIINESIIHSSFNPVSYTGISSTGISSTPVMSTRKTTLFINVFFQNFDTELLILINRISDIWSAIDSQIHVTQPLETADQSFYGPQRCPYDCQNVCSSYRSAGKRELLRDNK